MSECLDENGYPHERCLSAIVEWPIGDDPGFWDHVADCWNTDYGSIELDAARAEIRFVTGGWSGNEDVIGAIEENSIAYSRYWFRSERGGVHVFGNIYD